VEVGGASAGRVQTTREGPGCIAWILLACQPLAEEVLVGKLVVVFACSAMVVVGYSSVSVDCAPLVSDGSRCVCPEGTVQVDDWVCELPDGGTLERPGRPDTGVEFDGGQREDSGTEDAGEDAPLDELDAGALADLVLACSGPARSASGSGSSFRIDYDIANRGNAAADRVAIAISFFDSFAENWSSVRVSTVAAVLDPSESANGTIEVLLPPFVVFGDNRFRCEAEGSAVDPTPEDNAVEAVLRVDSRPNLRVVSVVPREQAISSYDPVAITMENAGDVAVVEFRLLMQYEETGGGGGGGSFVPGGPVSFDGTREGSCNSSVTRCGPLLPGDRATITTGWCANASDEAILSGGGFATDEVDRTDNLRVLPSSHYAISC